MRIRGLKGTSGQHAAVYADKAFHRILDIGLLNLLNEKGKIFRQMDIGAIGQGYLIDFPKLVDRENI